jgi:AcrR family transcriptional regulator
MSKEAKSKQTKPALTQDKILSAATKVFAERGFRDATTRMICKEAGVNVALVNYYFRSKAELYKAVIADLFEDVAKPMISIADSARDAETWKAAVRTWVRRFLGICAATKPPEYWVARLMGMEECVPSDMAEEIMRKFGLPLRNSFLRLLRMGMEQDDPIELNLWYSRITSQYVVYAIAKPGWAVRFCPPGMEVETWLDHVAEDIFGVIFGRLSFLRLLPFLKEYVRPPFQTNIRSEPFILRSASGFTGMPSMYPRARHPSEAAL